MSKFYRNLFSHSWFYAFVASILAIISIFTPVFSLGDWLYWLGGYGGVNISYELPFHTGDIVFITWYLWIVAIVFSTLLLLYSISIQKGMEYKWDRLVYLLSGSILIFFTILYWRYELILWEGISSFHMGFASIGLFISGILAIFSSLIENKPKKSKVNSRNTKRTKSITHSWFYAMIGGIFGIISILTPVIGIPFYDTWFYWIGLAGVNYYSSAGWLGDSLSLCVLGVITGSSVVLLFYSINTLRGRNYKWEGVIYLIIGSIILTFTLSYWNKLVFPWLKGGLPPPVLGFAPISISISSFFALLSGIIAIKQKEKLLTEIFSPT